MSERLVWVDKMRGLAILSVVVQHLSLYYVLDFAYAKLIAIANMSVFFFISGYIWERTAHVENIREAGVFILKKSIQLVIPLVVWTFISPWFFHIGWELPTIQGLIAEYEKPHLWFLLTLYGYVFWFALYKLMLKWGGIRAAVIYWMLALCILFAVWRTLGWFKLETLYIIYFAVGVIISLKGLENRLLDNAVLSAVSIFAALLFTDWWDPGATSPVNIVLKVIVSFGVICITYLSCTRLRWGVRFDSFIQECGRYSLAIYVVHWSFLNVGTKIYYQCNELLAFIPVFIYAVIICFVCVGFKKLVEQSFIADLLLFGNIKKSRLKK